MKTSFDTIIVPKEVSVHECAILIIAHCILKKISQLQFSQSSAHRDNQQAVLYNTFADIPKQLREPITGGGFDDVANSI